MIFYLGEKMSLDEIITRSILIQQKYSDKNLKYGHKEWQLEDYMAGLVKDIGDLSKLIMVKNNLRDTEGDLEQSLKHEIGDCFWSLIIICHKLGITPEEAIITMLGDLDKRLSNEVSSK